MTSTAAGDEAQISVVVVDDHASYAHGLASVLEALADDVRVAGVACDVDEAVSLVEQTRPNVAFVDVRMPQREGLDLAAKLSITFPETRVAMLSGFEDEQDLRKALASGARGYLSKEANPYQLIAAIRAIQAGFLVVSGFIASRFPRLIPDDAVELTDHEVHVLKLLAQGQDISTIAREMLVSESTLKRAMRQTQLKLGVESRIAAVVEAAKRGLL